MAVEQLVIVVNCMTFFSYSVTVFQLLLELELLAINKLQLQLELTDAYFSVITGFQLQLLLSGITLRAALYNEASAELTTANGGTFTSSSARLGSKSRYSTLDQ